jgi:alkanesulfonate monooxygenase SsuD/methylene tetrahydromethanopterin reductase-like flavin-dependent oxidoreductase (luciferase family)
VNIGLALPQYDYSVFGESPLRFETIVEHANVAASAGYSSLWLSDHLFLDIAKYGGSPERHGVYEPLVTLAALSRLVPDVRLGTLVLLEALRPASVLTKALASLDLISGGRLDIGLGAGWYEPEYAAIGQEMPRPGERLDRLRECIDVVTGLLGGGPLDYDGRHHRAAGAQNLPPAMQQPRPRVLVGGKGDRLLALIAEHADGWNTCWAWTPADYRERLTVLEAACSRVGRDPASIWRSLGLYALCGENQSDLERRYERLKKSTPAGVLDGVSLQQWRQGRLVGTVQEVREQAEEWDSLGVETLIIGAGALPFHVGDIDDVEMLGRALVP